MTQQLPLLRAGALNFASLSTDLEWTVVLVMNQLVRSLVDAVTMARLLTDIKEIAGLI